MKVKELVGHCVRVYDTYKPSAVYTEDMHLEDYIAEHKIVNEADIVFIDEVFYGVRRYKKLLKVLNSAFFFVHSANSSRADATLFLVVGFLAVIRLDDIGMDFFSKIVKSADPLTMHTFLDFLFDEETLTKWLEDEWATLYDIEFVKNTLIDRVMRHIDDVEPLLAELSAIALANEKMDEREHAELKASLTTVMEPFNLTEPKPKKVPMPFAVPRGFTASEPPPTTYEPDQATANAIEREKERRRQEREAIYARDKPFEFSETHAERKKVEVMQAIEAERDAQLAFDKSHYRGPPAEPDVGIPVRLNAAAILREEAVMQKKLEEDVALLKAYEEGQHDGVAFAQWQAAAREADEAARVEEIQQRRLELQLAAVEAKAAREEATAANQALASRMKSKKEAGKRRAAREAAKRRAQNKRKIAEAQASHKSAITAKARIEREKLAAAAAVDAETRALRERKEAEDAAEKARKAELIREIRALERVRKPRVKVVDPTETAGVGLLAEMSYAELQERLALAKVREGEEAERRRQAIVAAKADKQAGLAAKMEKLAAMRARKAAAAAAQRESKKAKEAAAAAHLEAVKEEKMLQLAERLREKKVAKRRESETLTGERETIAIRNRFMAADKDKLEETRFAELEKAEARAAQLQQEKRRTAAERAARAKARDDRARAQYAETVARERQINVAASDAVFLKAKSQAVPQAEREDALRKKRVAALKREREEANARLRRRNPYADMMTTEITAALHASSSRANNSSQRRRRRPQSTGGDFGGGLGGRGSRAGSGRSSAASSRASTARSSNRSSERLPQLSSPPPGPSPRAGRVGSGRVPVRA